MNVVGWYIQDDFQFSPNLTFNLGLRHEFYTVPNEVQGKLANLRDPLNDATVTYNAQINTGEAWFNNPSKASFMPRVGTGNRALLQSHPTGYLPAGHLPHPALRPGDAGDRLNHPQRMLRPERKLFSRYF
jgi:hypothetical protein